MRCINGKQFLYWYTSFVSIESKATELYGPLRLHIILIEGMKETSISISQLCNGGLSGSQNVVIFTSDGMRCFSIESIREALALIDKLGVEIIRGYISNGVYVYNQNEKKSINEVINKEDIVHKTPSNNFKETKVNNKSATIYLTEFKPVSLYDHIHMVTGHPGNDAMIWHLKYSTNAKFTEEDANRQRGACKGCAYGTMHKMVLITEENIEIFLLKQDNISLWMHTSTIAIPQEDINIVISIRI